MVTLIQRINTDKTNHFSMGMMVSKVRKQDMYVKQGNELKHITLSKDHKT